MQSSTQITDSDYDRFEALFNNASIGIIVVDSYSAIQSANPFALKLFGYTTGELKEKPVEFLIPQRFRHNHINHRNSFADNPISRPMGAGLDLFALKKDGTEFPVEISLGTFPGTAGESTIVFIIDISVRKKADAEISKLNDVLDNTVEQRTRALNNTLHQLELSRKKLEDVLSFQKALLDNAGAMIIATNEKGIITLFNPEASLDIGYAESEVVGKETPVLFHDKTEIDCKRKQLLDETGELITDDFSVLVEKARRNIREDAEYSYIRKNGTSFPVSLTITSLKDKEENITGFMGIAINIAERKKAAEILNESLKKEKELSELKSRFVSMASHEFRSPLSTVLSSAYLIEKYTTTEEQEKRDKHLRRIVSSVNTLKDILNDFLSVGKIEEGKIEVRAAEFNMEELVKEVIDEMEDTLKRQQKIHYRHEGEAYAYLDSSLMKHIVINLISNASKFSPEGGLIEVKSFRNDHNIVFSVKDHGMGISIDDQKHLMERFFRGANTSNIQGTGLGLHIVSKHAALMNGIVECKSELEKGTEFVLTFNT